MTINCCVHTCKNIYKSKRRKVEDENNVALMFHYFPKNKERKATWINSIRKINGSSWEPKDPSFVCSEHFDRSSWERIREDGKRKLKIIAIPSVFNENRKLVNDHTYAMQMPLQDEQTFNAIWKGELTFRLVRKDLMKTENVNVYDAFVNSLQYVWTSSTIPKCHNITTKILRRYFTIRYKQFGQMKRQELKEHGNAFSSKSVAMHKIIK